MTTPPPRVPQVRLSRQKQAELVERYRAGALRRELAEAYGIATGTVSNILKRHDALRPKGLDPALVDEAFDRYESGDSLATIGEALATTASTVRAELLRRGVRLRSPYTPLLA